MKDIDEFIQNLPRNEQVIVKRLRSIIMGADPRIKEKFSYGVPYYFLKRRVCFIWPQSAPYGPKRDLVSLGFCYGHMLSNNQGVLLHEGRTQVFIVHYSSIAEINERVVKEIILEALLVDGLTYSRTKKKSIK